jgi:hypothetical protein
MILYFIYEDVMRLSRMCRHKRIPESSTSCIDDDDKENSDDSMDDDDEEEEEEEGEVMKLLLKHIFIEH